MPHRPIREATANRGDSVTPPHPHSEKLHFAVAVLEPLLSVHLGQVPAPVLLLKWASQIFDAAPLTLPAQSNPAHRNHLGTSETEADQEKSWTHLPSR